MTGNPKTDASPAEGSDIEQGDMKSVRLEVPYGGQDFQVRLWHLQPGGTMEVYPGQGVTLSRNVLISGALDVRRGCIVEQPGIGQAFEMGQENRALLQNDGKQEAILLEVCWGNGFQPEPLLEVTETRPWGSFTVLKDEPDYKLKQLTVNPGSRLSLQRHQKREEHWLVTCGEPEVTLDESTVMLAPQKYIRIPLHSWHRIANPGVGGPVEIIELQLGQYFGEDDIERREDDYGRA